MWKDHKTLNRIDESIAGWYDCKSYRCEPYYIRYNSEARSSQGLEYTTEEQPEVEYPDEIFKISAGEIDLFDEGEFGGHLAIGGKTVCRGNFSQIFEFKGDKYVIDDLHHLLSYTFRLIKVNDNGTIDVLYDANQYPGISDNSVSVGLDAFYIGDDFFGSEKVYFLCSGFIYNSPIKKTERLTRVKYLLIFDPENKSNPFIRIDLPVDKVEFSGVTSIWTDGIILAIGCDKQVVIVNLPDMSIEYWTELESEEVEKILKRKHEW